MSRTHAPTPHPEASTAVRGAFAADGSTIPPDGPRNIVVRCHVAQLRVVMLWQMLGEYASRVLRTQAVANPKTGVEELSLTFTGVSDSALVDMVNRLAAQPWVLDAWIFP